MKDGTNLEREQAIFDLLLEVGDLDGAEREALLADRDPAIAAEVRAMLEEDEDSSQFLATEDVGGVASIVDAAGPSRIGTTLGRYHIVGSLGAGGMGEVYLAEQSEPVRRRVALKILPFSLALPQHVRRRFADEQRAMERLNHPNVGKILDAGSGPDDAPYLVMELIDGVPITTYCDERALPIDQRLRLFSDVCRGVAHAHRRFLLHRDIKPSNVLVTEIDGRPVPKLIDFGIAKMLDTSSELGLTGANLIGTPSYMSPEALRGERELDTRTDVYSLGVLLYTLLVGRLPWDGEMVSLASFVRGRLEKPAQKPSTQLTDFSREELEAIARARQETAEGLVRRLRGDLDWIVSRSIAAEVDERYGSAAELAADIERHLVHEPIQARPWNPLYLLNKGLRRHRTAAIGAFLVILTFGLGSIGTSIGFLHAREREAEALEARDQANQLSDFMVGLFRAARPGERTANLTARELLDRGAESLETELGDQPERRARLQRTLGEIYNEWGLYEEAEAHLEASRAHRRRGRAQIRGRDRSELRALRELAEVWRDQRRLVEARALAEQALSESPNDTERAESLDLLASILVGAEDYGSAEEHLRHALELRQGLPRTPPEVLARSSYALGSVRLLAGDLESAAVDFEQAVTLYLEHHGATDYRTGTAYLALGRVYSGLGRAQEADSMIQRAYEIHGTAMGSGSQRAAEDLERLRRLRLQSQVTDPGRER